jgi:hypothetical protein
MAYQVAEKLDKEWITLGCVRSVIECERLDLARAVFGGTPQCSLGIIEVNWSKDIANGEEGCVVVGFQACHVISLDSRSSVAKIAAEQPLGPEPATKSFG